MLRRLLRRSMAPRRPLLYERQYGLALVTVLVLALSAGAVIWALLD